MIADCGNETPNVASPGMMDKSAGRHVARLGGLCHAINPIAIEDLRAAAGVD